MMCRDLEDLLREKLPKKYAEEFTKKVKEKIREVRNELKKFSTESAKERSEKYEIIIGKVEKKLGKPIDLEKGEEFLDSNDITELEKLAKVEDVKKFAEIFKEFFALLTEIPKHSYTWYNSKLGASKEKILKNCKWYGDELGSSTQKPLYTLFFPSESVYRCNAKNEEDLEKIILNTDNWVESDFPVYTDESDEIKDIDEYWKKVAWPLLGSCDSDLDSLLKNLTENLPTYWRTACGWYNTKLVSDVSSIKENENCWYGDEPNLDILTTTLFFPMTLPSEYKATKIEDLKKIILEPRNWKSFEVMTGSLCRLGKKIKSIDDYIKKIGEYIESVVEHDKRYNRSRLKGISWECLKEEVKTENKGEPSSEKMEKKEVKMPVRREKEKSTETRKVTRPVKRGRGEPTESMEEKEDKTPVRREREKTEEKEPVPAKRRKEEEKKKENPSMWGRFRSFFTSGK